MEREKESGGGGGDLGESEERDENDRNYIFLSKGRPVDGGQELHSDTLTIALSCPQFYC